MAKAKAMILDFYEEGAARVTQLLESLDVEVVCWKRSGTNWFKEYGQHRPDFLFVDLLVPDRDGIYCINRLIKQDPSAICVLLHPYVSKMALSVEEKALKAGAAAVVQKPIVSTRFNAMMNRFLDRI
ncbi:response regulator [bacterium]|nr:response regulator [bacterium]